MKNNFRLTLVVPVLCLAGSLFSRVGEAVEPFPGTPVDFYGVSKVTVPVGGEQVQVLIPAQAAPGRPWVLAFGLYSMDWDAVSNMTRTELELVKRGFHVVSLSLGNTFGADDAIKRWDPVVKEMTGRYGLAKRFAMMGLSREGLAIARWAALHPGQVSCLYMDKAVCDIKSWPGGKLGGGTGSLDNWQALQKVYHFNSEAEALAYDRNPVDLAGRLAADGVAMVYNAGETDDAVPFAENGAVMEKAYASVGAPFKRIMNKGEGHHPHGLADPTPVVEFIVQHSSGEAGQRFELSARASEIDPRAKEHPEIGFVFTDKKSGKPSDVEHAVVDTRVPSQGKLVIWLMSYNSGLFDHLASYGLHSIQVHYANGWFGELNGKAKDEATSIGNIRLEAATGEDHSPLIDIPQPDGIQERAFQFVKWLAHENPEGQWGQFLNSAGTGLRWDKVILSGISHGSTTAARLAKHLAVDRVVMFSGPRDQLESWQALPSATAANRYFGFTHVLDSGWTGDHYCRSWLMLGLHEFGPLVNVETSAAPYGNSRRLITDADVKNDAKRAHSAVVPGGSAVKDNAGKYIHEAVWRYLFTHPVEQVGTAVPAESDCQMNLK